jgi:hypothetical protein
MSSIAFWVLALIGACFALAATATAVRSIRAGQNMWEAFEAWVVKIVDAMFGIGWGRNNEARRLKFAEMKRCAVEQPARNGCFLRSL